MSSTLPSIDAVLARTEIGSTEDLTRALRGTLPLQHRLALAWAIFDDSSKALQRVSSVLVRRNELLADWLFSTMLRELKAKGKDQYRICGDVAAIRLLLGLLARINTTMPGDMKLETRTVLPGPLMPLFAASLAGQLGKEQEAQVEAVADLWLYIVGSTMDGAEALAAQPDQLAQLLKSLTEHCLNTESEKLRGDLLRLLESAAGVLQSVCETTTNARKMFSMFDQGLLVPLLQLVGGLGESSAKQCLLDLLQVSLFHADCMGEFATALQEHAEKGAMGSRSYVKQLFDLVASPECMDALPDLFTRYLRTSALVCPETRSMANTTLGLAAVSASPLSTTQEAASSACIQMFTYVYHVCLPRRSEVRGMEAINRLINAYYSDRCFGTANNASIVSRDVFRKQIEMLEAWLAEVVTPILARPPSNPEMTRLALDAVDIALDAAPDSVQEHSSQIVAAFAHVPPAIEDAANNVLEHMVTTFTKARQLDVLVQRIAGTEFHESSDCHNMLVSEPFIKSLNLAVSRSMPFAQAHECLAVLVDAVSQAAKTKESAKSTKRRRTSKGATESSSSNIYQTQVVCVVAANFLLASVSSVNTEHQRGLLREALTRHYAAVSESLAGRGELVCEYLVMHYAFMEAASRIDGMERWMEVSMDPGHVSAMLPSDMTGARVRALAMLVVLQAAAHWSVFMSSLSAGIVPGDVAAQIDTEEGSKAVSSMIARIFASAEFGTGNAGQWDRQPHTITEANSGTVQWYLLVDWLELVCQLADQTVIQRITSRIIAEIALPAETNCSKALLSSAAFFEAHEIRSCFVPALAEFVAEQFPKQPNELKSLLVALAGNIGTKSKCAQTASDIISAASNSRAKRSEGSAEVWVELVRSLLRFPDAYWFADKTPALFAVLLAIDQGVACEAATVELRVLCRALLERLIRTSSGLLPLLTQHAAGLVSLWMAEEQTSEELLVASRRLLFVAMGSLAQAAFGQANLAANKACVSIAKTLLGESGSLAAEGVRAIAGCAKQYAKKLQKCEFAEKWAQVSAKCIKKQSKAVLKGLAGIDKADDTEMTAALGRLAAAQIISESATGEAVDRAALVAATLDSLSRLSAATASEFALALVFYACHTPAVSNADTLRLLASMTHRLAHTKDDPLSLMQQSFIALISEADGLLAISLSDAVAQYAVEPLLRQISSVAFEQSLVAFLKIAQQPNSGAAVRKVLVAFIRMAYRQSGNESVEKRKAVQRRLGNILSIISSGVGSDVASVIASLSVVSELVLEPFMRFTMFDISECLAFVSSVVSVPLVMANTQAEDLFRLVCRVLGGIIRHHTNQVLDGISLLVNILRSLLHAFVVPVLPRSQQPVGVDSALTPWIIAYAPFPAESADSYARLISELVRARRFSSDSASQAKELVKLTRGTNTSGVISTLSSFAPYILAEYCVIQGGDSMSSMSRGSDDSALHSFQGLCWQPLPVLDMGSHEKSRGIIANPAVREMLVPAWHALLDVMRVADRESLLSVLAGTSRDAKHSGGAGWSSIFGPDRYGGANEVLKALYQSYLAFYKYTGEV